MQAAKPLGALTNLRITSFIVHIIDHTTGSLKLSGLKTPVGPPFPHDFFKQYILLALADPLSRRACFRAGTGVVSGAFAALRADPARFVDESKAIANHLYGVMDKSPYKNQIKAGDIMVALFQEAAEEGQEEEQPESLNSPEYLAILKIDPSDAVIRRVVPVNGQQQVIFETRDDRVPTAEENKIQKIALIGERQPEPEPHDLVILDNNIKQVGVAQFFYDEFLESSLNREPGETTQKILGKVKRVASKKADLVKPPLAPLERLRIIDRTAAFLRKGVPVTPSEVAEKAVSLPGRPKADVEAIRSAILEDLTSRGRQEDRIPAQQAVQVSRAAVAAQTETIKYVLDGGIQITGAAEEIRQRVQISPPNAAGEMTVTITTQTLEIR
jgi:nucleoid associated protein NdpA